MRRTKYSSKRILAGRITEKKLGKFPVTNTKARAAWEKEYRKNMRLTIAQLKRR